MEEGANLTVMEEPQYCFSESVTLKQQEIKNYEWFEEINEFESGVWTDERKAITYNSYKAKQQ